MSIQSLFETFHTKNPHVYKHLVTLARQVRDTGYKHYSINSLFERLRWHYQFDVVTSDRFKLNNNFRSRYARLVMEKETDLQGFFKLRSVNHAR